MIGHPKTDDPAWAWIEKVRRTGDRLQAKLRDIAPQFREAVEANRYSGRSIAFKGDSLRHLGFLGGRKPAVDGLAPTQFSSEADETVVLSETELAATPQRAVRMAALSIARLMRGMRERIIASEGVEAANEALPDWEIENLNTIADDLKDDDGSMAEPQPATEGAENMGDKPNTPPTEAELAARAAEMDARDVALKKREKAEARRVKLAACEASLKAHVEAGRILPAEVPQLSGLLASLPDGEDGMIEFASDDGDVRKKPADILEALFAALPVRVGYAELAAGKVPPSRVSEEGQNANDNAAIAAEAQALMSEAADRGVTLTTAQAVDQVRAKRGLNGES